MGIGGVVSESNASAKCFLKIGGSNYVVNNTCTLSIECAFSTGSHDVQNISVSSPHMGSIAVNGYFIQGSTAIGILIITINGTNDTQYHLYHRNGNNAQVEDTISGLAGGDHRVSAFVLEQGGYPFNRTATTPKSVFVINGKWNAC